MLITSDSEIPNLVLFYPGKVDGVGGASLAQEISPRFQTVELVGKLPLCSQGPSSLTGTDDAVT